jgi:serine/threonine protein kinase
MTWSDLIGAPFGDEEHHYIIESEIARGGMSRVFRARETDGEVRDVALKVMALGNEGGSDAQTFAKRFEHEAHAVKRLDHPNIVKVFATGRTDEFVFIAMQLVMGGTFRQRLGRPMSIPDACYQMIQMARALHHAHMHHVIHRDVKPANMLIDDQDPSHLLLADFGIAKIMGQKGITKTGTAVGTPEYMAPEQAKGEEIDPRADIYGLACVLYEALAGRPPFVGPTALSICYQHVHTRPAYIRGFNPDVPRPLALVIDQALQKNPRDRFNTAEEFANALYPFTEGSARVAHSVTVGADLLEHMRDGDNETHTSDDAYAPDVMPVDPAGPLPSNVSVMLDLSTLATRHSPITNPPTEDDTMRQTQEMVPVQDPGRPRHTRPERPKSRPITRPREAGDPPSSPYAPMGGSTDVAGLATIQTPTPFPATRTPPPPPPSRPVSSSRGVSGNQPARTRIFILIGAALVVSLLTLLLLSHLRPAGSSGTTAIVPTATTTPVATPTALATPTAQPTKAPTTQTNIAPLVIQAAIATAGGKDSSYCNPANNITQFKYGQQIYINFCLAPGYGTGRILAAFYWNGTDYSGKVLNSFADVTSGTEDFLTHDADVTLPLGNWTVYAEWNGQIGQTLHFTIGN